MNETLNQDFTIISNWYSEAVAHNGNLHKLPHDGGVQTNTGDNMLEKTVYSSAAQHVNTSHQLVQTLHSNTTMDGSKLCHSVWAPLRWYYALLWLFSH